MKLLLAERPCMCRCGRFYMHTILIRTDPRWISQLSNILSSICHVPQWFCVDNSLQDQQGSLWQQADIALGVINVAILSWLYLRYYQFLRTLATPGTDSWVSLWLSCHLVCGVKIWSVPNDAYVDKICCYLQELVLSSLPQLCSVDAAKSGLDFIGSTSYLRLRSMLGRLHRCTTMSTEAQSVADGEPNGDNRSVEVGMQ